jgi:hypothetical protein
MPLELGSGNSAKRKQSSDAATASLKWRAMLEPTDLAIALYVILVFVAFLSGMFLGASLSPNRRKEREPWYARPIRDRYRHLVDQSLFGRRMAQQGRLPRRNAELEDPAKGGLGRDGKVRSANLLAFVIAFVVGVVVLDHFTGPLFPDLFYSRK